MTMTITMWQCDNFWITRKPQIMTLRLLIWKGSVMISPSSQGQLREDQINGQRVCLPSLVFTVGLFVASRGRFFLVGGAGRWNRVVGAPILLRSSTRPPTFPSRRSWGSHPWHCDQYHHHQKDHLSHTYFENIYISIRKTTISNWTLVTSLEEDWRRGERIYEVLPYCLFLNNLPYFFPRSKSISKVS